MFQKIRLPENLKTIFSEMKQGYSYVAVIATQLLRNFILYNALLFEIFVNVVIWNYYVIQ